MPYVRRKPRYTKSKRPSFAKRVRKVISATAQVKHTSNTSTFVAMDNSDMYFTSPTQNLSQGTAINQRIGDMVKLKYLKIQGNFNSPASANATVKFRVAVFYSSDANAASSVTAGAFAASVLFMPNTTSSTVNAIFDPNAVSVLADLIIDHNSIVSTAKDIKSFAVTIPLKNAPCKFKESGSTFSDKKNLYIMVTGVTSNGAIVADIGDYSYAYDLAFQDI